MKQNRQGFTLIELVVAVAIFTILGLTSSIVFSSSLSFQKHNQKIQELNQGNHLLVSILKKDIQNSSNIIKLKHESNIYTLTDLVNEHEITYQLKEEALYRNNAYLIDGIENFTLHELGDFKIIEKYNNKFQVMEGIKIIIRDRGGNHFEYPIYYRR